MTRSVLLGILFAAAPLTGCEELGDGNTDGGTEEECPGALTEAPQTCADPDCSATTGLKIFGQSELDSAMAKSWIVPVWATSEIASANEMTTLRYRKETVGGLTPAYESARMDAIARARAFYGDEVFNELYASGRAERIRGEAAFRALQQRVRLKPQDMYGTGIRPRFELPKGVIKQGGGTCTAAAPTCGETALCLIAEGASDGTCETALTLKFNDRSNVVDVAATVKKVGEHGAIVVDDAVTVSDADVTEMLARFDTHIAPLDHQVFGTPGDRDQNGVVIIFLTPKLSSLPITNVVGIFASDDLMPVSQNPDSNGAEILYMREPGGNITLDQISGTIAHEYQHLINYYAKVINGQSSREEAWLDEGLASFAEDISGYGSDAFENIAAYLGFPDQTSLTGDGDCNGESGDTACRRGMAHLLVRYYFEQRGGARISGPGMASDQGGLAAVRALVQSTDTGTGVFGDGAAFGRWVGDLVTTVASDGAGFKGVSCNPKYKLDPPADSSFTNYQIGIDLRSSFRTAAGSTRTLMGPATQTLETEDPPLWANAGEFRTVSVSAGKSKISVGGSVDFAIGYHALPADK